MNKYLAIVNWIDEYTPLNEWTYFNVVIDEPNTMTVNSVSNGREIRSFIDGTREVEFLFAISLQKSFDSGGTSNVNLDAIQEFENIALWIEANNKSKTYPNFGDNVEIEKIEVMQTAPTVTVDQNGKIAKYLGQFKITYLEGKT